MLNDYVDWMIKQLRRELIHNFVATNDLRIEELEISRKLVQDKMVSERQDRNFSLDQAICTATALNIETPTTPQELAGGPRSSAANNALYADIKNNEWHLPLVFYGTKVLKSERVTIQNEIDAGLSNQTTRDLTQQIEEC